MAGYEVLQIDECLFNSDHFQDRHWALSRQPIQIKQKYMNQPKIVVMGAIGVKAGNVHYKFGEFSFKTADVIAFLKELRVIYDSSKRLAVFWDNCRIHLSLELKEWLIDQKMEIELVYNIPYRPDLNGIEVVWHDCKKRYRDRLNNYKAMNIQFDHMELVKDIVGDTSHEVAARAALKGEKCIMKAKPMQLLPKEWAAGTIMRPVELIKLEVEPDAADVYGSEIAELASDMQLEAFPEQPYMD